MKRGIWPASAVWTLRQGALMAALLASTACSTMPNERPEAPAMPTAWVDAPIGADIDLTEWWRKFNDPDLTKLVAEALTNGPSLQLAASRIDEARGQSRSTVAQYLPHRPRPTSTEGLRKNLRQRDGRWYWHWDPRFFDGPHPISDHRHQYEAERVEAVRNLRIPALLVRGGSSELVKEANVKEFLELAPHAKFVDVAGARHMVAGDRNDVFSAAIADFLAELPE